MIRVVFNPTARGNKARAFRDELTELASANGRSVHLHPTTGPGTATAIAREAVETGCKVIVAAGGDGTVNEVLNGLATAKDGLQSTSLGVLPLGTVNVFAKELGIPADLPGAWEVLVAAHRRTIDLPFVEPPVSSASGLSTRRYFAQMAGAGLDSCALGQVNWELKKRLGAFAYVWACVGALRAPRPQVQVALEETSWVAPLVAIGNGRYYGGRFPAFPRARLDDGLLDVTIFKRATLLSMLRVFIALQRDRVAECRDVVCLQSKTLNLSASDGTRWHVEGDNVGALPVQIALMPATLRVVVPEP